MLPRVECPRHSNGLLGEQDNSPRTRQSRAPSPRTPRQPQAGRVRLGTRRGLRLNLLPHRSLQLGLTGEAAARYADEWIVGIRDVTPLARRIHEAVRAGRTEEAGTLLPEESPYPVPEGLLTHLGA
ncbi:DUF4291 family protein [Streptomyces griseoluteus]|uniref:DUF4291 family protein n=1 Tax=Streptomyces griseoluteus TaxID=29306 RepID=UPI0036B55CBD